MGCSTYERISTRGTMKPLLFQMLAATLPIAARTELDKSAVQKFSTAFSEALSKHGAHALAEMMASDVDCYSRRHVAARAA